MPRGRLNERYVQRTAVEWLASNHYQERLNTKAIVPTLEACIRRRSRIGYGRADGLLAAQLRFIPFPSRPNPHKLVETFGFIQIGI